MAEVKVTTEEPILHNEIEEIPIRVFAAKGDDGKDGKDGIDGSDGRDGVDGVSPTVETSKTGNTTTITITDVNGVHTATIKDGEDGTGSGDMSKATYDTNNNGVVDNAEKVNNHTVEDDVPMGFFSGEATKDYEGTNIEITNAIGLQSIKIKGDDQQQNYTGKNLFSGYTKGINLNPTNGSQTSSTKSACSDYIPLDITGDKSFVISGLPTTLYNFVAAYNSSKEFLGRTGAGTEEERILTVSSFSGGTPQGSGEIAYIRIPVYENVQATGTIADIDNADIQLESGSTPTSYEPYVGSTVTNITPAPNPDYPQDIHVVTGEQTVTVSNGTNSQSYTINLGTTELCKVGNYQDYIYKSGNDWFVHKGVGKKTLTTIDSTYNLAGTGYIGAQIQIVEMVSNSRTNGYCNRLVPMNSPAGATTERITFGAGNSYLYMVLADTRMASSTKENWDAWLASNNTIVYYPLATPTDTKITDSTLIGQLNALAGATIYEGITYMTSSGNLPAILAPTALVQSTSGLIEAILSSIVTYTAGTGIAISENNEITNTSPGMIYTAGTGISINNGVISCTFADGDSEEY